MIGQLASFWGFLSGFLRWWGGEVTAITPRAWRLKARRRHEFEIRFLDVGVELRALGAHAADSKRHVLDNRDDVEKALSSLRDSNKGKSPAFFTLVLDSSKGLTNIRKYPQQAKDKLRHLTALEIKRSYPFAADDIYFDVGVQDKFPDDPSLTVEQVFAKQSVVDNALARASDLGLIVDRISLEDSGPDINLLPDKVLRLRRRGSRQRRHLKIAALASLVILAVFAGADRQLRTLEGLREKLGAAQTEAATAQLISTNAQSVSGRISKLRSIKNESPSTLAVWEELSRAIPDSAWVTEIKINEDTVSVSGYAREAAMLINELEKASGFSEVGFQAPVTLDRRENRERFTITMIYTYPDAQEHRAQLNRDTH